MRTSFQFAPNISKCLVKPSSARPFSSSIPRRKSEGLGKDHALDKPKSDPNVHSNASHEGRENRQQETGGTATEQRDTQKSTEKAKKEQPEAPEPIIGMQDERGGKGH